MDYEKTLVLCRTPLQLFVSSAIVIEQNVAKFDLLYITQDNTPEDRNYFDRLALRADESQYLFVRRQRFDILNHIIVYFNIKKIFKKRRYKKVLVASIDSLPFQKILSFNFNAEVSSFDDGLKHISFFNDYTSNVPALRTQIYHKLFVVDSPAVIASKIVAHYSMYPQYKSIVEPNLIKVVEPFKFTTSSLGAAEALPSVRLFIGQPFHEYCSGSFLSRLEQYIKDQAFDYYVKHPRELRPLCQDIPVFDKRGRLAEEAIVNAGLKARVHLFGCFSNVMINIPDEIASKSMIIDSLDPAHRFYADMAIKSGCSIVEI